MSTEKLKPLTKAEEQVMQAIWKLNKAFLREIVDAMPAPKPHQNTVATLLKILIEKKYVKADVIGRMHQYYPAVSKDLYSKASMKNLVKGYFQGSFSDAVSFMVKENNLSIEELELLLQNLKKK